MAGPGGPLLRPEEFVLLERFAGLVLTEVDPANAPDLSTLVDDVRMVVDGVSP